MRRLCLLETQIHAVVQATVVVAHVELKDADQEKLAAVDLVLAAAAVVHLAVPRVHPRVTVVPVVIAQGSLLAEFVKPLIRFQNKHHYPCNNHYL